MHDHIVELILAAIIGAFFSTGTTYFWTGTRAHRSTETLNREHSRTVRAARQVLERNLREDT